MSSSSVDWVSLLIILIGYVGFAMVVGAIVHVVTALTLGPFFARLGVPTWTAWVPYLNYWRLLEAGGLPGALILTTFIPGAGIVASLALLLAHWRLSLAFGRGPEWLVLYYFLPWVWWVQTAGSPAPYRPEVLHARGMPPHVGYGAVPARSAFDVGPGGLFGYPAPQSAAAA